MNGIQALQHMGVHLDALQRENEVLRAALRQLIVMARTSGGTAGADAELMKACQRENEVLRAALRQLIVMARTSGGTAGADAELMKACGVAESAIAKAKGE